MEPLQKNFCLTISHFPMVLFSHIPNIHCMSQGVCNKHQELFIMLEYAATLLTT